MAGCSCGGNGESNLLYACSGAAITGELIETVAERIAGIVKP